MTPFKLLTRLAALAVTVLLASCGKMMTAAAVAATVLLASCANLMTTPKTYLFEVTNELSDEFLAPILVAPLAQDGMIFVGSYVSDEAEVQILTGDPSQLADAIGYWATVAHGNDGPPGILLASGKSLTFRVVTDAPSVRVLAMVAPTKVPDNYVSTVVSLGDSVSTTLDRFDIGHNEGTRTVSRVSTGVVSLSVRGM